MTFSFPSVNAFRAADPRRLGAVEIDFGGPWRTATFGPAYRAAWLPATGELVLIRLGDLPPGADRVELIAQVSDRSTLSLRDDMASFPLPIALPDFTISMLWHPRMDADPAHRWLRQCFREVCTGKAGDFLQEQC